MLYIERMEASSSRAEAVEEPDARKTPITIHHSIKQCDWPNVANSLVREHELTLSIIKADKELSTRLGPLYGDADRKVFRESAISKTNTSQTSQVRPTTRSVHIQRSPSSTDQTFTTKLGIVGKQVPNMEKTFAWASGGHRFGSAATLCEVQRCGDASQFCVRKCPWMSLAGSFYSAGICKIRVIVLRSLGGNSRLIVERRQGRHDNHFRTYVIEHGRMGIF